MTKTKKLVIGVTAGVLALGAATYIIIGGIEDVHTHVTTYHEATLERGAYEETTCKYPFCVTREVKEYDNFTAKGLVEEFINNYYYYEGSSEAFKCTCDDEGGETSCYTTLYFTDEAVRVACENVEGFFKQSKYANKGLKCASSVSIDDNVRNWSSSFTYESEKTRINLKINTGMYVNKDNSVDRFVSVYSYIEPTSMPDMMEGPRGLR